MKLSVLLITVRPSIGAYLEHPDWHVIGRVVDDLAAQTYINADDFELVVVDGLYEYRKQEVAALAARVSFEVVHVPPRPSLWVQNKKVAICAYRNTGLALARGELVVNLDDCCVLPSNYLAVFWQLYEQREWCAAMTWPQNGDWRKVGDGYGERRPVRQVGCVYGFSSYPRKVAIEALNGYDEAYDGGQGLEDMDWAERLMAVGVQFYLITIPGFHIEAQSAHDPRAVDAKAPVVKCCNAAYQTQRRIRTVIYANDPSLWDTSYLRRLLSPCQYIRANMTTCDHHGHRCAFLDSFALSAPSELQLKLLQAPPVLELRGRV